MCLSAIFNISFIGVYPVNPAAQLDPKDRVLMKEPAGSTGLSKAQPAVSFLRRTEYISSEIIKQKSFTDYKSAALKHREEQEKVNPEDQLRAVEATFDAANEDIGTLKHPTKKSVHAVDSWSVLPDSKMLDLVYLTVKIVGSAALSNQKRQYSRESLSTALFRRNVVDNDEWMTFFAADEEAASALKEKLDSPLDTLPVDDEDTSTYSFNRIQDHDIDLLIHSTQFEEIGIRFSEKEKQAKYVPIIGRTNLKRRRVLKQRRERVNENTIGAIDLSLREITAEESIVRDNARSVFDPVSYTATAIENVENEQDEEEDDLEQLAQ